MHELKSRAFSVDSEVSRSDWWPLMAFGKRWHLRWILKTMQESKRQRKSCADKRVQEGAGRGEIEQVPSGLWDQFKVAGGEVVLERSQSNGVIVTWGPSKSFEICSTILTCFSFGCYAVVPVSQYLPSTLISKSTGAISIHTHLHLIPLSVGANL